MRFLMCALLFATCSLPMSLCAQFDDFQLNYCGARGVLGSYLVFLLDIVDPSTSANNSVVCQYDWYAPGMVNSSEVPTDSNISWESSDLNENYMPCTLQSPQSGTIVDRDFEFYIQNFVDFNNFAIQAHHAFMDPAMGPCAMQPNGTPVYCDTNLFAQTTITPTDMTCTNSTGGYVDCTLAQGLVKLMPVYAETA